MLEAAKAHEKKYLEAKSAGLPGWGGIDRISQLPRMIDERFFALKDAPRQGRLLELGCGAGNLSLALAERGFDVYGVDFSATAIEWAKENAVRARQNIQLEVADVCDLSSLKEESFDIVYDGYCFHCIIGEKRMIALAEWKRVLKPGGLLFISSLCATSEDAQFPDTFDTRTRVQTEPGFPSRYITTPEHLEAEIQSVGFEILKVFVRTESPFGHINIHARRPD
jgi:ubiquinone/menaquinone biosynthesis C-methylase UbiE